MSFIILILMYNREAFGMENQPVVEKYPIVTSQATFIETVNNNTNYNFTLTSSVSSTVKKEKDDLPAKGAAEAEHHSSMTIFFILLVVALCILVIHFLIRIRIHFLPESVAVVFLGALIGLVLKLLSNQNLGNWQKEEAFSPTTFFLILLPPIIFESGYNLHKGNFFQNIGSILVFSIFGTTISALVIGGGIFLLGVAEIAYKLSLVESFVFGSLISAVDPVATVAIFHALDVDPVLNMLVFGESILNDAVSIVLATTILELSKPEIADVGSTAAFFHALKSFCMMFFISAFIGVVFALASALLLKHLDLRKTPSLEFGLMIVLSYASYGLAEGLHLSGIMAILFCGIVMSHYTHFNLSPVTQITMQQTLRMTAFIAETCVFAYLGLAIFSFKHIFKPAFVIWSIVLCLVSRAVNIYPLSFLVNFFREHKITKKMQFIMWFSGLRGAIAFALAIHLEFDTETRHVLVTTTLIIVLFTVLFLGGSTMPLMKLLNAERSKWKKNKSGRVLTLSKTQEVGDAIDAEHLSELTEEEYEVNFIKPNLKGFTKIDVKYLIPFFTRRFTHQELKDAKSQMKALTNQWYQEVRGPVSDEDISEDETEISQENLHQKTNDCS